VSFHQPRASDPQGEDRKALVFAVFEKLFLAGEADNDNPPSFKIMNQHLTFYLSAQERDDLWQEFKESP
jgi:hypothetical protein